MILYMPEYNEGGGLWLVAHDYARETREEAEDAREEFLATYDYIKSRDVRIAKFDCRRVERKAKRGAKR